MYIANDLFYESSTIYQEWSEELSILEKELPKYLYDFPYENHTSVNEMFDDSTLERKLGVLNFLKKK